MTLNAQPKAVLLLCQLCTLCVLCKRVSSCRKYIRLSRLGHEQKPQHRRITAFLPCLDSFLCPSIITARRKHTMLLLLLPQVPYRMVAGLVMMVALLPCWLHTGEPNTAAARFALKVTPVHCLTTPHTLHTAAAKNLYPGNNYFSFPPPFHCSGNVYVTSTTLEPYVTALCERERERERSPQVLSSLSPIMRPRFHTTPGRTLPTWQYHSHNNILMHP